MKIFTNKDDISTVDLEELRGFTLLVDKDVDWTSFDVVKKLKSTFWIKKIGHAGTLDPFATGLLIVCLKKATKTILSFQDQKKIYQAVIELGKVTDSYDVTGNVIETSELRPSQEEIKEAIKSFVGDIEQTPPMFSALKVNGQRLYNLARKGIEIERKKRNITIYDIRDVVIENNLINCTIECSKGTYIRSIAYDIGNKLGCGGYLKELRRTHIGDYCVDDAFTVPQLIEMMAKKKEN